MTDPIEAAARSGFLAAVNGIIAHTHTLDAAFTSDQVFDSGPLAGVRVHATHEWMRSFLAPLTVLPPTEAEQRYAEAKALVDKHFGRLFR